MGNTSLKHIVDTSLATTHSLNLSVWNECTIMIELEGSVLVNVQ